MARDIMAADESDSTSLPTQGCFDLTTTRQACTHNKKAPSRPLSQAITHSHFSAYPKP